MTDILKIENLKKYFNTPKGLLHAVDDVNFTIKEGETLGLVGESGCGKSTIGRLVLRLLEATSGSVEFDGKDILNLSKKEMVGMRSDMQIIFQDPFSSLNPRMSVSEIIGEPLIIHNKVKKSSDLPEAVKNLMDRVGLANRLINSYPHELDGGRRQRIGIARALALEPKFIVADEPVSALDVSIQAQILNLMQDLQDEFDLTYLFITHDLSVVKHFSDNIAVMYLGQLVEKAPKKELFENPMHPYTEALLSAIPVPSLKAKRERILLKGEISSPINPKPGCRFASRCPYAFDKCTQSDPKLVETKKDHFVACYKINS
ncbi:MAG: ATP-binding cassette domain-containing protein [Tissierellia bacterium]|nr:ATP-binding cassette domain-containing protein [Tissierellia bacterium]